MIPDIYMHRFEFHQMFSKGNILDVGCANGAGWRWPRIAESVTHPFNITTITFVDCDEWQIPNDCNFIRAFAEDIPVEDNSFDTVVLGDILEHVKDPNIVLQEAKRITKDRIVITVPNEWKWEQDNPNIKAFETREKHLRDGKDLEVLGYDSTIRHPCGDCMDALNDVEFEHIHHTRFYNEETFEELIRENSEGMNYHLYNINYNQLNFVNLAAIMWFDNEDNTIDYDNIMKDRIDIRTK